MAWGLTWRRKSTKLTFPPAVQRSVSPAIGSFALPAQREHFSGGEMWLGRAPLRLVEGGALRSCAG